MREKRSGLRRLVCQVFFGFFVLGGSGQGKPFNEYVAVCRGGGEGIKMRIRLIHDRLRGSTTAHYGASESRCCDVVDRRGGGGGTKCVVTTGSRASLLLDSHVEREMIFFSTHPKFGPPICCRLIQDGL